MKKITIEFEKSGKGQHCQTLKANVKKSLCPGLLFGVVLFTLLTQFHVANAQLQVIGNLSQEQVKDLLFGPGATISNFKVNGSPDAFGTFYGVNSNIGLKDGVLITSGTILNAIGPNNSSSRGSNNNFPGDKCISSSYFSYDANSIEFDVVLSCDSIKLDYVFASEEYPEFSGSTFRDKFLFLISGSGIKDTVCVNSKNIALIPGTSLPVSIYTVNQTTHANFYVDNQNGTTIQYDGFTTVLRARQKVVPGSSYHVKIVIADVNDAIFDSGIFLKNASDCGASELSMFAVKGISDQTIKELAFKIDPNPFNSETSVSFTSSREENIEIDLFNMQGALVKNVFSSRVQSGMQNNVVVNGNELNKGIYFIRFSNENGSKYSKIMLTK